MDGIQKTVSEFLEESLDKVSEGAYGQGDDFDTDSFKDDIENFLTDSWFVRRGESRI